MKKTVMNQIKNDLDVVFRALEAQKKIDITVAKELDHLEDKVDSILKKEIEILQIIEVVSNRLLKTQKSKKLKN